ncbi:MAG TPA: hypothetical protein VOA87_13125 [Thermoanaerobaculia bacterium]|nr:hypothetical protein [Thermoanaerobaculia bacterium]
MRSRGRGPRIGGILAGALLAALPLCAGPGSWTPFGPDGGSFMAVAVDPGDAQTIFASSDGAVYVSHDGGDSWSLSNSGLEGQAVIALAFAPGDPTRLFALSTFSGSLDPTPAVFRSDDAGAHWSPVAGGKEFLFNRSLLVLPGDAVLVGTDTGIWRSANDGATWLEVFTSTSAEQFHTLVADPDDPQVVYGASLDRRLKSLDGGVTWSTVPDPAHNGFHPFINALALAPSEPQTLYETGGGGGGDNGTYRSRDGGATWEGPFAFGAYLLEVDPHDAQTLYGARLDGLYVSRDGALTWSRIVGGGLPSLSIDETPYYSMNMLVADPRGDVLVAAKPGLLRSADAGRHWTTAASHGLHHNPVTLLAVDPFDPRHWLIRSFSSYLATHDDGASFTPTAQALETRKINLVEFDPRTPGRLLAVAWGRTITPFDLLESRDGGATWKTIAGPPPAGTAALTILGPRTLLALAEGVVYRSNDGAGSWRRVLAPTFHADNFFSGLIADPQRPTVAYALGTQRVHNGVGEQVVYRSTDSGHHWGLWATGFTTLTPDRRAGSVYLAQANEVWHTRDDGRSFQLLGQLPANDVILQLLVDRARKGVLYATAFDTGVWRSADGGASWQSISDGLPVQPIDRNAVVANLVQDELLPNRFYATPAVGGLYRIDLPPPAP